MKIQRIVYKKKVLGGFSYGCVLKECIPSCCVIKQKEASEKLSNEVEKIRQERIKLNKRGEDLLRDFLK